MLKPFFAVLAAIGAVGCATSASATAFYDLKLTGTILGGTGGDGTIQIGDTVTMTAQIPVDLVVNWNIPGDMVTSAIANHTGTRFPDNRVGWNIAAGGYTWNYTDDEEDGYDEFFIYDVPPNYILLAGPSIAFDSEHVMSVGSDAPLFPAFGSRPQLNLGQTPSGEVEDFYCCSMFYSSIPVNTGFSIQNTDLYANTSVPQNFYGVWDYADSSVMLIGVPEPATWTMMLSGVFAVGTLLRRSRRGLAEAIAG